MPITTEVKDLKRGDLCVYSGFHGVLHPVFYWGEGQGTYQFVNISKWTLDTIARGKKPRLDYISGFYKTSRVVKIDPSVLDAETLNFYNQLKPLICR